MENRKAYHNYFIEDSKLVAGLCLVGSEVKSLRENKYSYGDSYISIENDEAFLINFHISDYKEARIPHENLRKRKLLLNKKEIERCKEWVADKGNTIVPLEIFLAKQYFKLRLGFAKGKKQHDKRETIKKRDIERETQLKL